MLDFGAAKSHISVCFRGKGVGAKGTFLFSNKRTINAYFFLRRKI